MDLEPPRTGSHIGPIALLWVTAVVVLNWIIYGVPLLAGLTAGLDLPLMTGTTLAVATVDPSAGTVLFSLLLATVAVLAILAHGIARRVLPEDRRPGRLPSALLVVPVLGALALPAEWCAGGLVPDLLSVGPIVVVAAVLGVVVPVIMLVASINTARWLLSTSSRNPFFGGVVAALGTLLLAPPATAATSLFLLVQAVEAASELPAPHPAPLPAPPPAPFQIAAMPAPPSAGASTAIEDCFEELEIMRPGVEQLIRSRFRFAVQEAEDVASDAMISICVSDSLSAYSNLEAVYTKAAKNKAIDIQRKRRGEVGVEAALCLPFYPDDWRLPSELVLADQALGRLDSQTQDAIRLWSMDEPHTAIALRLGITNRKSRDLVGNGLKSMRRYVGQHCAYAAK